MYDYCIVGGGIVGKYLAHLLRGKNVAWVSGHNPLLTSSESYQLGSYLGKLDTWQEKATGLISFPAATDIATFPFSLETYRGYQTELIHALGLKHLQSVASKPIYVPFIQAISNQFPGAALEYFWSGHTQLEGPSFESRDPYEYYWQTQKPQWDFLAGSPDFLQADFLNVNRYEADALVGRDQNGQQKVIKARHFILACHTPGNIALVQNTFAKHRMFTEHMSAVGQYFSDHLQLSFGFLAHDLVIPRTSLASMCFQDREIDGLRFRLEFHNAPPRKNLIQTCLSRMPQYSQADFFHHFIRIVAIAEFSPMAKSQLFLQSGGRYSMSKQFTATMHHLRAKLDTYLRKELFAQLPWIMLNRHRPMYYGGHLIGGLSFPGVLNDKLVMHDFPNVSVAGSCAWQSGGLFNPTFTSLVFAKHLVASLPCY